MGTQSEKYSYVLVTPARNEEKYIEETINSVISQSISPKRWVIVSDGSSDRTDEIVRLYAEKYDWMKVMRMPEHRDRQFAAKVNCFNAGYEAVRNMDFDIIGNLDADLSFDEKYFEFLLQKFEEDSTLGVAGTPFVEANSKMYDYRFTNIEHVSGGCQLFRRRCFEEIGGYIPIRGGGIDWVAVTTARMKGWKTRTFTEKRMIHLRRMGTGKGNILAARFRQGTEAYYLGSHPLWEFLRIFYQVKTRPWGIGAVIRFSGYLYALTRRMDKPVTRELVEFYQKEQMSRLKRIFFRVPKII
jgi:biofilm PGA synthesis N-glycosyltransferase PgaC